MNHVPLTIVGNLTEKPELRFTTAGVPVLKFTVAHTPRAKVGEEWKDGEPTFMNCTAWRHLAEHIAASLVKGSRVIVYGRLRTERWETEQGEKRIRVVMDADSVGAELTYATAVLTKAAKNGGGPADDPWATASKTRPQTADSARQASRSAEFEEEPPF